MIRWLLLGALLLGVVPPAAGSEPRLLMSWRAPYGTPGARDNVDQTCDTTLVDTLYLSVDPGRAADHFLGVSATLYFHAPEGQGLTDFWKIADVHSADSPLKVVYSPDPARGFVMAWNAQGVGDAQYDYVGSSGRLRLIYAIASSGTNPVRPGKVYGVARVLLRHPGSGGDGCERPMCVEWHAASLAFGPLGEPMVNRGVRWVSINSPGAKVCDPVRDILPHPAWHPKTAKP